MTLYLVLAFVLAGCSLTLFVFALTCQASRALGRRCVKLYNPPQPKFTDEDLDEWPCHLNCVQRELLLEWLNDAG